MSALCQHYIYLGGAGFELLLSGQLDTTEQELFTGKELFP